MSNSLCSLKNCHNRQSKDISLFLIPKNISISQKWLEFMRLNGNINLRSNAKYRLCANHFQENEILKVNGKKRLKKGSIPFHPDLVSFISTCSLMFNYF